MIVDLRSMPDQSVLNCELCIIGGGAAGITMALEFAATGIDVLLLESGGLEFENETQSLYRSEDIGLPYFDLEYSRLRYFGGTTNHWGGMSRPLDPIDFERREWVAHSGWPITYNEFAAYLPRANKVCGILEDSYDTNHWMQYLTYTTNYDYESNKLAFEAFDEIFNPVIYQYSSSVLFGVIYRSALERSGNIKVLLNANVTSIDTLENPNKVNQLSVITLTGKRATVRPKQVVLATGGIENARILLTSNKTYTQGLGNCYGLVGRFFADHIELESGYILSQQHSEFFNHFSISNLPVFFAFDVSPEMQRIKKIVNLCMTFESVSMRTGIADGIGAGRRLKKSLAKGKWPNNFFSDVRSTIIDIDEVVTYLWSKNKPKKEGLFSIMNRVEPQPNPDSRVTLSDDKDALGIPKVKLNWQLTELDYHSIYEMQHMLAQLLGKSGYGRLNIEIDKKFENWPDITEGGNHHMGTTRMASNASEGVVDVNCKVFGIENLYIAGSSIFPTYGKANPTMNLLALAIRLADHLKVKMKAMP